MIGIFKGAENKLTDPEDWTQYETKSAGTTVTQDKYIDGKQTTKIVMTSADNYIYKRVSGLPVVTGQTWTFHAWVYSAGAQFIFIAITDTVTWAEGWIEKIAVVEGLNYIEVTRTFGATVQTGTDCLLTNFDMSANSAAGGSGKGASSAGAITFWIIASQSEQSAYKTPYTPTSRPPGSLWYPYSWAQAGAIECWVRPWFTYDTDIQSRVFADIISGGSNHIILYYEPTTDKFQFFIRDGSTTITLTAGCNNSGVWSSANVFASNTYLQTWIHFKTIWDGINDQYKLYVNGSLIDSSSTTLVAIPFYDVLQVGGIPLYGTGYEFDGLINDFNIWPTADVSTDHYTANKPYYADNRILGKNCNMRMDNFGNAYFKRLQVIG